MARERAIANQLIKLFKAAAGPIFAVDDRREIIYCNAACATTVGVAVEELVGQRCDYHGGETGNRLTDIAAMLCPPPECFAGEARTATVQFRAADESLDQRTGQFLPLTDEEGEVIGVLAFLFADGLAGAGEASGVVASQTESPHQQLQRIARELRVPFQMGRLVGKSLPIHRVRDQIQIAIRSQSHVQIVGPRGSGREHVARSIHCANDPTAAGPLMPLSCPLLDGELLQATVVAFLQRAKDRDPIHPATLLLLDADQLNAEAQAEMLAFFRVPTFNLRVIATTRTPLLALASEETFLAELASRLSGFIIQLPRLAERREDIPLLCQQFLEDYNARGGKQLSGFDPAALDQLCALPWDGNVEELAEVVAEICEQCDGPRVTEADLSRRVRLIKSAMEFPRGEVEQIKLDEFLVEVERELLQRAMKQAKGNKAHAARLLGISRPRLLRRISQLGIE